MTNTLKTFGGRGKVLALAAVALTLWLAVSPPSSAAPQKKRGKSSRPAAGASAAELFSLGFFYYNNSDVRDDNAAKQFGLVIKNHPKSEEAEKAQFFLASYYQRKYYIRKERYGDEDNDALEEAKDEYEKYIEVYPNGGPCQCLSDAYFHLALVHLQEGNKNAARHQLQRLFEEAGKDPAVYIYQVVWTSNSNDVIDSHFDAQKLAKYTTTISDFPFSDAVNLLKKWCRDQRSK